MLSIHLRDLIFYSYHGIYPEEKILGGKFRVNIEVKYLPGRGDIDNISTTIDYVGIFEIIKGIMGNSTPLLETLVQKIADSIFSNFQIAEEIFVMVEKCHPPISGLQGSVGVSLSKKRID